MWYLYFSTHPARRSHGLVSGDSGTYFWWRTSCYPGIFGIDIPVDHKPNEIFRGAIDDTSGQTFYDNWALCSGRQAYLLEREQSTCVSSRKY